MTSINESDVFSAAIAMERTGIDFYEALGLGSDDAKVRDFCEKASRDESRHLSTFHRMQREWLETTGATPASSEQVAALAALARKQIQPSSPEIRKVAIGGKLKDALHLAMQMEQNSIDFYQKIQAHLPSSAQAIDEIIAEEKKHLDKLQSLTGRSVTSTAAGT